MRFFRQSSHAVRGLENEEETFDEELEGFFSEAG
jgi:hypothetical protein